MRLAKSLLPLLVIATLAVMMPAESWAQGDNPDRPLTFKIHEAIRRGVNWLKSKQAPEGHFGEASGPTYTGGGNAYHHKPAYTAFALFCLLKCEVPTTDPCITKGFTYLRSAELKGVYEHAIVIMAIRELYYRATVEYAQRKYKRSRNPVREVEKFVEKKKGKAAAYGMSKSGAQGQQDYGLAQKCVDKLLGWQNGGAGWRYGDLGGNDGAQDVSATHLALFGLKAATACNIRVDKSVFAGAAQYLLQEQDMTGTAVKQENPGAKDGSWSPMDGDRARGFPYMSTSQEEKEKRYMGAMTGAGVIGLMVCKSELLKTGYWRKMGKKIDKGINDGVAWMNQNWSQGLETNPYGFRGEGYHWWVVERVGILGGLQLIGQHNWYLQGAQHLVGIQKDDPQDPKEKGFWDVGREVAPTDLLNTIYALLFLKKHAHSVGIPPITRGGK